MATRVAAIGFFATACLASLGAAQAADEKPVGKPNVILVVIDDLGWADLGCYGSTFHKTPNLDRMAADGARFTQFYAACPVCSPTRASIMTGKWPARLHLTDWLPGRGDRPDQKLARPAFQQALPLDEVTLAEVFHDAGYATAHIGKWHLGGAGFEPTKQGFDLNIAGDQAGSPASYFAPYRRQGRVMPGLEEAPEGEYLTDRLTDETLRFIERNRERPFFVYLPHFTVHIPLQAKPEWIAKHPAATPFRGAQNSPVYAAMIDSLDESIGRMFARLAEWKLDERTIVLFTSDNGGLATLEGPHTPATSNAPLREGKGFLYEGGVRVPMLAKWPGKIRPGTVNDTPAASIDLFPTLVELCGLKSEARPDGVSLAPLLTGAGPVAREALYWHYPHYANQGGKPGGAIRSEQYKLIEYYENGRRELFDVSKDPRETQNLADKSPEVVERLAKKLDDWRRDVGAQMPTPNPNYVPNPQADDGSITLAASSAEVHGTMLRYEPMPHKNTLGFWVRPEDWASWEFTLKKPGKFQVTLLQGCGNGSGGSDVEVSVAGQKLRFQVEQTGGFQAFVPRMIGEVTLSEPGRHALEIRPQSKPGPAVMDVRQVRLTPVAK